MSKLTRRATIKTDEEGYYTVTAYWSGGDLKEEVRGLAWCCGKKNRGHALANRLKRAFEAGAILPNPKIMTRDNGTQWVSADLNILGRRMNADLKRVGF